MEKRQRKYRAWHVEQKKMLYNDFSIISTSPSWSGTMNFGGNDEELRLSLREWDTKRGDILGGDYTLIDWACFSDLIVMDWTGLTDGVGVDLYEKDILISAGYDLCVLEYSVNNGCFYLRGSEGNSSFVPFNSQVAQFLTAKGNIYQNPELLTS